MFALSREYTRNEIHDRLGGSKVSCLPTRDGRIVAACLSTSFSPEAPKVVLCGTGARTTKASEQFAQMRTSVPVFIKAAAHRWRYEGLFTVKESVSSGARFEAFIKKSDRSSGSVSYVVVLEQSPE